MYNVTMAGSTARIDGDEVCRLFGVTDPMDAVGRRLCAPPAVKREGTVVEYTPRGLTFRFKTYAGADVCASGLRGAYVVRVRPQHVVWADGVAELCISYVVMLNDIWGLLQYAAHGVDAPEKLDEIINRRSAYCQAVEKVA